MIIIKKKEAPSANEIRIFLTGINFRLPEGFIEFFSQSNGALISGIDVYIDLWPLTDMIRLNKEYDVDIYAKDFFIFGSNGGETAYCIKKETACIYDMPFIGMPDDAILICKSFTEFLQNPPS